MSRINPVSPSSAEGKTKELFEAIRKKSGRVPNALKTMGHSSAALEAYLGFSDALNQASLSPQLREQIALSVAEENRCGYCIAAHTAVGKMAGLDAEGLKAGRESSSADPKTDAALKFAQKLVRTQAKVSDKDVEAIRAAGYSDAEITEMVAVVSLNIFTNYFNHVAEPVIDFPKV